MFARTAISSLIIAVFAAAVGIGIYQYDNQLKDQAEAGSWLRIILNSIELLIMGPGLGLITWQVCEGFRQREERSLRRLEEERERRFHLLGRIAASVAHEIRNPLHNLRLIDEQLRSEATPNNCQLIDRMDANLERLDHAVALVYELSRPNRLGDDVELENVELHPLMQEAVSEAYRRVNREICLVLPPADQAPVVLGRAASLRIIFGNLVRNAVEAAGDHPVTVHYRADGRRWVITLSNPGCLADDVVAGGIPPASAKPDGMGVGLSIARHLIDQLRGSIWFTNRDGQVLTSIALRAAERSAPHG